MSALVAKELQEQNKILEQLVGNYIIDKIYPIGSIYISTRNIDPSIIMGGSWLRLKDRFLLGSGDIYNAGELGGKAERAITIDEMPSHHHYIGGSTEATDGLLFSHYLEAPQRTEGANQKRYFAISSKTGGNQPHNNMPPYIVVHMWERVS